jgi:hypothetical protein
MISSYSLLAAALAVIASHTTPAVASSFVSNQLIGDHTIVKRTLEEEGDMDLSLYMSAECQSESASIQARIDEEVAASNLSYSCKDAGGQVFKLKFEGSCPFSIENGFSSGHSGCVGTSCTIKEHQAVFDAAVEVYYQSFYDGCSNLEVSSPEESSGAFSLGTASCVLMASSLLLSTAALLN